MKRCEAHLYSGPRTVAALSRTIVSISDGTLGLHTHTITRVGQQVPLASMSAANTNFDQVKPSRRVCGPYASIDLYRAYMSFDFRCSFTTLYRLSFGLHAP